MWPAVCCNPEVYVDQPGTTRLSVFPRLSFYHEPDLATKRFWVLVQQVPRTQFKLAKRIAVFSRARARIRMLQGTFIRLLELCPAILRTDKLVNHGANG